MLKSRTLTVKNNQVIVMHQTVNFTRKKWPNLLDNQYILEYI